MKVLLSNFHSRRMHVYLLIFLVHGAALPQGHLSSANISLDGKLDSILRTNIQTKTGSQHVNDNRLLTAKSRKYEQAALGVSECVCASKFNLRILLIERPHPTANHGPNAVSVVHL